MSFLLVAGMLAACAQSRSSSASPSPTAWLSPSPSPKVSPAPSTSPNVTIQDCPAKVSNSSGRYSFQCPAGWKFVNCEASESTGSYTWLVNPPKSSFCLQEAYGARMLVWSQPGDHSADPENHVGIFVGERQSSQPVTVAGVSGTRRSYLVTADYPLPPPKNTVQILYTFLTGGRTYFADYDRYPGEADLTTDFDRMITGSFGFSP